MSGRFIKGQSGNPGGRPKPDREVVELAREASPKAMRKLIELIDHEDPKVAAPAANSVLDRAYGKATQPLAGDDSMAPIQIETPPSVEALVNLSAEDRGNIRAILRKAAGRSEGDGEGT